MFATHRLDAYTSQASQHRDLEMDSVIADLWPVHRLRRSRSDIVTTAAKFTSVTPTRVALHRKVILDSEPTTCELHETTLFDNSSTASRRTSCQCNHLLGHKTLPLDDSVSSENSYLHNRPQIPPNEHLSHTNGFSRFNSVHIAGNIAR
jgi:hypothetical protein